MDCCPVGELRRVWDEGLQLNQTCSCGAPFLECPFWTEVFQIAFGGFDNVETKTATHLRQQIDRYRRIPWHWLTSQAGLTPGQDAVTLNRLLAKLYRAILDVSGADFVLDSSKDTPYGFLLAANPELDVRMLQLVRDSRAVAFSWQRRRPRPEVRSADAFMLQLSPRQVSWIWLTENVFAGMYPKDKFLFRLNYEQFVAGPQALVDELAAAGFPARQPQKAAPSAEPPSWHTVAGNPNRFNKRPFVLEVDDEWTRQMSAGSFLKVTAMTFPLLMRYGYSLRRNATPGRQSLRA
jgi:hypothetical protein